MCAKGVQMSKKKALTAQDSIVAIGSVFKTKSQRRIVLKRAQKFSIFNSHIIEQPYNSKQTNLQQYGIQTNNSLTESLSTVQNITADNQDNYKNVRHAPIASTMITLVAVRRMQPVMRHMRNPHVRGPASVFFIIYLLIVAIKSAIMQRLSCKTMSCTKCHGFGIERCILCGGTGGVNWEGKYAHQEPCPMCIGKRYTRCMQCGGLFHRQLFKHSQARISVQKQKSSSEYDWDHRAEYIYGD